MRKAYFVAVAMILAASASPPVIAKPGPGAVPAGKQQVDPLRNQAPQSTGDASMSARQHRAEEILRQMLPLNVANSMASRRHTENFGGEMSRLAFENAYLQLWARPGLSPKERSLVTISILIALGNEKELGVHLAAGLRNGLTPQELEEVIYHSTAYAGFPRASEALAIASAIVPQERNIDRD
jgi:4-carboxymuconolactone decarboxylase